MSTSSNYNGRALEYAILKSLEKEIKKNKDVHIRVIKTDGFDAINKAWNKIKEDMQSNHKNSAITAVSILKDLEPIIFEPGKEPIELMVQVDKAGVEGDSRDILIKRHFSDKGWEIGLSIKHNHQALKHSRLSRTIDFGKKWYGIKCSDSYWNEVNPIFDLLDKAKSDGLNWRDLPGKAEKVYLPLIRAFKDEIKRSCEKYGHVVPKRMAKYLIGIRDYYKVIGISGKEMVEVQCFNLRGELNKPYKSKRPVTEVIKTKFPDRLLYVDLKPSTSNRVEMCLNNGWQFDFRIHSASTKVEPSLKFDINLTGMPATFLIIEKKWF